MMILCFAFLLGMVSGLRTFTSIAAVCWAARYCWPSLAGTAFAFVDFPVTLYLATALALGELIADKLPSISARTKLLPFAARLVSGGFCGVCLATAFHPMIPRSAGLLAGVAGAFAGTLGGIRIRAILSQAFGRDLPAALLEDGTAIALAFVAAWRSFA